MITKPGKKTLYRITVQCWCFRPRQYVSQCYPPTSLPTWTAYLHIPLEIAETETRTQILSFVHRFFIYMQNLFIEINVFPFIKLIIFSFSSAARADRQPYQEAPGVARSQGESSGGRPGQQCSGRRGGGPSPEGLQTQRAG